MLLFTRVRQGSEPPSIQHAASIGLGVTEKACLCQVNQFLAGDSIRTRFLDETEFWSIADLQQLAHGHVNQTTHCINDVVEDALSLATALTCFI